MRHLIIIAATFAAAVAALSLWPGPAEAGDHDMYTLENPAKANVLIFVPDTNLILRRAYAGNYPVGGCNVPPGVCPAACGTACPHKYLGLQTANINFTAANCTQNDPTLSAIYQNQFIGAGPNRYADFPFHYESCPMGSLSPYCQAPYPTPIAPNGHCMITSAKFLPSPPMPVPNQYNPAFDLGFQTVAVPYKNYNGATGPDEFNFYTTNVFSAIRSLLTQDAGDGQLGLLNNTQYGMDFRLGLVKFNRKYALVPVGNILYPYSPPALDGEGGCIENYPTSNYGMKANAAFPINEVADADPTPGLRVAAGVALDNVFNYNVNQWFNYPKSWEPYGEVAYEMYRYFYGSQPQFCQITNPPGARYTTPWGDGNLGNIQDDATPVKPAPTHQSYVAVNSFVLYLATGQPSQDQDPILRTIQCTDASGTNFACNGNIAQEVPAMEPQIVFPNRTPTGPNPPGPNPFPLYCVGANDCGGTHFLDDVALEMYRRDMILDPSTSYPNFPPVVMNGVNLGNCPNFPAAHQGNCNRQSVVTDVMSIGFFEDLYSITADQAMGRYWPLVYGTQNDTIGYDCTMNNTGSDCWTGLAKGLITYLGTLWSRNVNVNKSYMLSTPLVDVDMFEPWDCNVNRYITASFVPTQGSLFEGHLKAYKFGDPAQCELPRTAVNNVFDLGGALNSNLQLDPLAPSTGSIWDAGNILASWSFANPIGSGVNNNKRRIYSSKTNGGVFYRVEFEDDSEITPQVVGLPAGYEFQRDNIQSRIYRGITSYWEGGSHLISWKLGDIFHSMPVVAKRPNPFYVDVGIQNLSTNQQTSDPAYDEFLQHNKFRDRVIYVGANDGVLHAFWGGHCSQLAFPDDYRCRYAIDSTKNDAVSAPNKTDGREMWAYLPNAVLGSVKEYSTWAPRLYQWDAGQTVSSRIINRPFAVDATPAVADVWIDFNGNQDGVNPNYKDCPAGYANYTDCEWRTYLVGGLGLGGRGVYGLDVGDVKANNPFFPNPPAVVGEFVWDDPLNPNPGIPAGSKSQWLGYTTSSPIIGKVKVCDQAAACDTGGAQREMWVAMFGGGYHPGSDPTNDDISYDPNEIGGRAFYAVNLRTMQKIFEFAFNAAAADERANMRYALAAPGRAYDVNSDGYIETVYIGDLGGQLWRFDLGQYGATTAPIAGGGTVRVCSGGVTTNCWSGQRLFAAPVPAAGNGKKKCGDKHCAPCAACGGTFACGQKQKHPNLECAWNCQVCATPYGPTRPWTPFWSAPAISTNTFGQVYLFIGSGDRQNLMDTYAGVGAKVYGLRDVLQGNPAMPLPALTEASLSQVTAGNYNAAPYVPNGWYRRLADGEKILYPPAVLSFDVLFATFRPNLDVDGLGNTLPWTVERQYLGDAWLYVHDFMTGGRAQLQTVKFNKDQFWMGIGFGRDVPTAPKVVTRTADATHAQGQQSIIISTSSGEFQRIDIPGGGQPPGDRSGRIVYWRDTF